MFSNKTVSWPRLIMLVSFVTSVAWFSACQSVPEAPVVAPPMAPIKHTIDADGHPLALWEKRPDNPIRVVLLLHGRTWSALPDFDLQVPGEDLSLMDPLFNQGYAVYGLDMRGYGSTPRDSTGWLTPDRAAADLAIVLRWLADRYPELKKPVLFGWSYGSMVSQLCVQNNPELVSGVILFGYPIDPDMEWQARDMPMEPVYHQNTAEAAASDFITPGSISQKAIDGYVEAALAADPVRVDWRDEHQFLALDPAKVKVPTLLIQGELDPLAPTEAQARFFTRLGTADRQWAVMPGGDHAAFMETPRPLFLHVMLSFIDRMGK